MRRIGVFVCWCGANIGGKVNVPAVVEAARTFPNVVYAEDNKYTCSEPGQAAIRSKVVELKLDRVVVASCSPRMHELTFQKTVETVGVNPFLFEMANIREHCSWCTPDKAAATEKAIALVRTAVAKAVMNAPLQPFPIPVTPRALVIGGGIAGIQAALDVADTGIETVLVERDPSIGGVMAQLDKTFPTLDCSACILTPKMVDLARHPKVRLMSYAEVEEVKGFIGNFQVKVRRKARYVDLKDCKGCGDCAAVCPVKVPSEYEAGLGPRTAIYRPFPQAVPGAFTIDKAERPPCVRTCPAGVNAQGYVALVSQGKFKEALAVEKRQNPFPSICGRVCNHPCETECNRGQVDVPVSICALKRFIADWVYADGGEEPALPAPAKAERVAVVGSGPAGLACAHSLALEGYPVTVFEALPKPGGMLRYGIPEYRLPKAVLDREIGQVRQLGVEIQTNAALGKDFSLTDLKARGYAAVFIATGAHKGQSMGVPGEDATGCVDGITFLRDVGLGKPMDLDGRVVVVGGGNTAVDAARSALRLGARDVIILYRRTRAEMPANSWEVDEAVHEGVKLHLLAAPVAVTVRNGRVAGLKCIRMELGEPDASGRRRPMPIAGSEFDLPAEYVVTAVSQSPDTGFADGVLELRRGGVIAADPVTLQTSVPGVFAGGDAVKGPATVVEAIAHGNRAAKAIGLYLRAEAPEAIAAALADQPQTGKPFILPEDVAKAPRAVMPTLELSRRRRNFTEVELGLDAEAAMAEAARCLNCGICCECRECERACEPKCIDHSMQDETETIEVGSIIVATGFKPMDPVAYGEYGYRRYPDVITSLEFERMCGASGPTGGQILRPSTGKPPHTVLFIQCVGSRDEGARGHQYCSKTCCMYTAKHAELVMDRVPGATTYVCYMDVRTPGKGYEEFYRRTSQEYGARYIRGRVAKVQPNGDGLRVRVEDTLAGRPLEVQADLVVLATAMEPQADSMDLARVLKVGYDADGFFTEAHPKLRPVETNTGGIFLAGACQGPKDIPETVAQASAAAVKAVALLSKDKLLASPIVSCVNEALCAGDFFCQPICPYGAIEEKELTERIAGRTVTRKVASVNTGLCQGCGACTVACRSGAINLKGYTNEQLLAEVDAVCLR